MEILSIYELKRAYIKNLHDGTVYPKQNVLVINFQNGDRRIVDLIGNLDITDIDYLEAYKKPGITKTKCIMKKEEFV